MHLLICLLACVCEDDQARSLCPAAVETGLLLAATQQRRERTRKVESIDQSIDQSINRSIASRWWKKGQKQAARGRSARRRMTASKRRKKKAGQRGKEKEEKRKAKPSLACLPACLPALPFPLVLFCFSSFFFPFRFVCSTLHLLLFFFFFSIPVYHLSALERRVWISVLWLCLVVRVSLFLSSAGLRALAWPGLAESRRAGRVLIVYSCYYCYCSEICIFPLVLLVIIIIIIIIILFVGVGPALCGRLFSLPSAGFTVCGIGYRKSSPSRVLHIF